MFSPTHTLLAESSEDEDDVDLPVIDMGTPKKPRVETGARAEQIQPTKPSVPSKTSTISSNLITTARKSAPASNNNPSSTSSPTGPPTSMSSTLFNAHMPTQLVAKLDATHGDKRTAPMETSPFMTDGLSPIKSVDGYRTMGDSKRTAVKVKKLTKSLKEKTDMKKKLEEFRSCRGIQGIAKSEEAKLTLQQEQLPTPQSKLKNGSLSERHNSHSSTHSLLSPLSSGNPGKAIFVRKPSLITELYPPGIDIQDGGLLGNLLLHGSVEDLKNIVCSQTLPLAYIEKPCPMELSQWLFQLMACSEDPQISSGALRSLVGLRQATGRQDFRFSAPSVAEIMDVLVSLGAERDKLHPPLSRSGTQVRVMPLDPEGEEVFSAVAPPTNNLINLTSYISLCVRTTTDYNVQNLEELVMILSSLSLDHHCMHILRRSLQMCIHNVLDAYPESVWLKAVKRLSPLLVCLSPHHHDHVALARLISGTRQRTKHLLKDFCRHCLVQMVNLSSEESQTNSHANGSSSSSEKSLVDEKDRSDLSGDVGSSSKATKTATASEYTGPTDCVFLKRLLESYRQLLPGKMSNEDYYKLHSFLHLLQLYAPVSDLVFPSKATKEEFISVLGTLRATVREDSTRPITSAVKDALIRMKLELEAQGGGTRERQTDLFSFSL